MRGGTYNNPTKHVLEAVPAFDNMPQFTSAILLATLAKRVSAWQEVPLDVICVRSPPILLKPPAPWHILLRVPSPRLQATLRLQTMIGVSLAHWKELGPTDDRCLTQLGGCVLVDGSEVKYEWKDSGICGTANFEDLLKAL
eukprot:3492895-Pleurochrysis_carterae.AAC.3